MTLRFWLNTACQLLMPGGWGYVRHLRRMRDPSFDVMRDRHAVRKRPSGIEDFGEPGGDDQVRYRKYASYDEYKLHQRQKLDEMLKMAGGFSNWTITGYRLRFYRRFRHLVGLLPPAARIVCLGARQGTEVEVLRELGFAGAYGLDLNPGPDNPLVREGDFMHLDVADSGLDLIYTNCVDHAFDLEAFFAEHARAVGPGYALYDVAPSGVAGPFEAASWSSLEEVFRIMLRHFEQVVHVESEARWTWVLVKGRVTPPRVLPPRTEAGGKP